MFLRLRPEAKTAVVESESFTLRRVSKWPAWLTFTFELTLSSNLWVYPSLASVTLLYQSRENSVPTVWNAEALWKKYKKNFPNWTLSLLVDSCFNPTTDPAAGSQFQPKSYFVNVLFYKLKTKLVPNKWVGFKRWVICVSATRSLSPR